MLVPSMEMSRGSSRGRPIGDGGKPANLPVLHSTKFELVISSTPRALGLDMSLDMLVRAGGPACDEMDVRQSQALDAPPPPEKAGRSH